MRGKIEQSSCVSHLLLSLVKADKSISQKVKELQESKGEDLPQERSWMELFIARWNGISQFQALLIFIERKVLTVGLAFQTEPQINKVRRHSPAQSSCCLVKWEYWEVCIFPAIGTAYLSSKSEQKWYRLLKISMWLGPGPHTVGEPKVQYFRIWRMDL